MNKKLLLISFIILYSISNVIYAQKEIDILDSYKDEFLERALSTSNRKVYKGVNELGKKVNFITYEQIQANKRSSDNLKSLVLTHNKKRITDATFNYVSISLIEGNYKKGNSIFRLSSQNILNEKGEATYIKTKYEGMTVNVYNLEVFDIHVEADLYISASVCENIELITKKYNEAYKTRTIEELSDLELPLISTARGYEETNEVLLRMIMKEREAIINNILKEYNSYFKIEIPVFITNPDQVWDEFYIDPIKYIKTICENSPLLK